MSPQRCRMVSPRSMGMLLVVVVTASTALGCRGRGWLAPPGPINQQASKVIIHDPYPQDDIAPSDFGGRPPDYQNPLPEPVRNRLFPDAMPWLGR